MALGHIRKAEFAGQTSAYETTHQTRVDRQGVTDRVAFDLPRARIGPEHLAGVGQQHLDRTPVTQHHGHLVARSLDPPGQVRVGQVRAGAEQSMLQVGGETQRVQIMPFGAQATFAHPVLARTQDGLELAVAQGQDTFGFSDSEPGKAQDFFEHTHHLHSVLQCLSSSQGANSFWFQGGVAPKMGGRCWPPRMGGQKGNRSPSAP